jgi:hypothetical protein
MVFKKKVLPATRINSEWDEEQEGEVGQEEYESGLPPLPEPPARQFPPQTPTRPPARQEPRKEASASVSEYLDMVEGNLLRSLSALRGFREGFKV